MPFELSSALTSMRKALRKFVKAELEPLEKAIDSSGARFWRHMASLQLLAIH